MECIVWPFSFHVLLYLSASHMLCILCLTFLFLCPKSCQNSIFKKGFDKHDSVFSESVFIFLFIDILTLNSLHAKHSTHSSTWTRISPMSPNNLSVHYKTCNVLTVTENLESLSYFNVLSWQYKKKKTFPLLTLSIYSHNILRKFFKYSVSFFL